MRYDRRSNTYGQEFDDTGYHFAVPESPIDKIMQALTGYIQSRGMTVDIAPAPYLKLGYKYLDTFGDINNTIFRFYNPVSVKMDDTFLEFAVLGLHCQRNDYTIHTVIVNRAQKKARLLPGKRYDSNGQFIDNAPEVAWFDFLPKSDFGIALDTIIANY